ncbi:MAG: nucleoside recognition domain-containing protein [Bacteroidales bacterium]
MSLLKLWFTQALRSFWVIFKIMLPVSIIVKFLQLTGLISVIGNVLAPLMELMGLPGEMGIVWASTMLSNIYGGMITLFSIGGNLQLTVAQITVLASIMLAAHTFPVELLVARKAGIKMLPQFILRFGFGLFIGFTLFHFYRFFGLYTQVPLVSQIFETPENDTLGIWLLNEIKNYGIVFLIIFSLSTLMDILKRIGWLDKFSKILEPILGALGISRKVIPITVIGLTLGIAYGGALIIEEARTQTIAKKDIFYAFVLMSLCHSIIEDSLLMMSIGASFTGVFVARCLFAFSIAWGIVRCTKKMSDTKFNQWFIVCSKKKIEKN